ncbi:MAG: hypothetical protein HYT07_03765 [Candidatus Levybacteria bacterium]|nr:hypothetical protein [Candidatus Levybacteria bacterium]
MDNQLNREVVGGVFKKKSVRIGILVTLLIVAIGFLLGVIKVPGLPTSPLLEKKAQVKLKTEYKNPFAKETQYVNPFDTYKNPFVVSK